MTGPRPGRPDGGDRRPLLVRLALFARRRYRWIFAVAAVLLVVSGALTARLRFDTDILNLLPQEDPVVRVFLETLEDFSSVDYLLVAVRVPEGAVLDPYETFVDELGAGLEELPQLESVEYKLTGTRELLRQLFPKAVLFLDEEGRQELARRLSEPAVRTRVQQVRRLMGTPQGQATKPLLQLDPLGLADLFIDQVQSSRGALSVDWASGYYLSRDRRMLLLLAKPARPPADVDFGAEMAAAVEEVAARTLARWPELAGGLPAGDDGGAAGGDDDGSLALESEMPSPPVVALGGGHMTAVDDARFIWRDGIVGGISSLVGVLLLFLFAFRRLGPLLFATLPLAAGLLLAFGFSYLSVGHLSSATSGTAALLIGLGVDFVIVSYGRYVDERRRGASLERALATMSGSSGRAVVVGALTTAATFYAFTVTDFTGLFQMGFLTGTGILLCMVSVLLLLPALLAWRHDRHERRASTPKHYLHSFGTRGLMAACMRRPRTVLAVGLAITLAALAVLPRLYFEGSMDEMRPPGNRGIQVTREVGERFGSGFNYMMVAIEGDTPEEVIALAGRAAEGARRLVDDGVLYGYGGITSLIPPAAQQDEVLAWLAGQRQGGLSVDRIEATFRDELAAEGLRYEPFAEGVELLRQALVHGGPIGVADYQGSRETRLLLERFLKPASEAVRADASGARLVGAGDAAGGWKSVVYLYPPENRWRREPPPEAVELADRLGPAAQLTGTNVLNQRVRGRIIPDAWFAGILGLVLVAVLLWLDFRTVRHTLLSLTPLVVGIVWMLAVMAATGVPLNFMNIFVTTMVLGIGVDYGLHILHRYRETRDEGPEAMRHGLLETGNAIVVAALSTVCGFGSLTLSHYPGLRSVGYVAVLGAVTTALVAITLLPAFLAWSRGWRGRRSGPEAGPAGGQRPSSGA